MGVDHSPVTNSLNILYNDACMKGTVPTENAIGFSKGISSQAAPGNGSALVTAGNILFWEDMNRRFHACDTDDGEVL